MCSLVLDNEMQEERLLLLDKSSEQKEAPSNAC